MVIKQGELECFPFEFFAIVLVLAVHFNVYNVVFVKTTYEPVYMFDNVSE